MMLTMVAALRVLLSAACLAVGAGDDEVEASSTQWEVDEQCTQPYTTLDDAWRSVHQDGGSAGDVLGNSSACHTATGVGNAWYRFRGSGGSGSGRDALSLPLRSPGCGHCGSDRPGWLSAWCEVRCCSASFSLTAPLCLSRVCLGKRSVFNRKFKPKIRSWFSLQVSSGRDSAHHIQQSWLVSPRSGGRGEPNRLL